MNLNYKISRLIRISHPDGDILKGIKLSDNIISSFGESYYSWINRGKRKAWRYHKKITNNFIVLNGDLNINIINKIGNVESICIKSSQNLMFTLFPKTWYGFECVSDCDVLINNIIDQEFNEDEILRKSIEEFEGKWLV